MSSLYIWEFSEVLLRDGGIPIARAPGVVQQSKVTIGAAATNSAAFNVATSYVRLHTDTICSIAIGKNPVATTDSARMAAGQTEYFEVNPGDLVSVIANT